MVITERMRQWEKKINHHHRRHLFFIIKDNTHSLFLGGQVEIERTVKSIVSIINDSKISNKDLIKADASLCLGYLASASTSKEGGIDSLICDLRGLETLFKLIDYCQLELKSRDLGEKDVAQGYRSGSSLNECILGATFAISQITRINRKWKEREREREREKRENKN